MKTFFDTYLRLFLIFVFLAGCTGETKVVKFPETTPEEVILKYFNLLGQGGRLTSEAAYRMVSTTRGYVDQQNFRKWTDKYSRSEIKPIETIMPKKPDKYGDWIATVELEVSTPSIFEDTFKTSSSMNLILDQDAGEWKIDFFATTAEDDDFRGAPAETFAESDKGNKGN